ncbi:hypothetical protein KC335_g1 [Hortaea werneckii]|nr:hypothetical protein KC335_g1 [Hortaea werneckii]
MTSQPPTPVAIGVTVIDGLQELGEREEVLGVATGPDGDARLGLDLRLKFLGWEESGLGNWGGIPVTSGVNIWSSSQDVVEGGGLFWVYVFELFFEVAVWFLSRPLMVYLLL